MKWTESMALAYTAGIRDAKEGKPPADHPSERTAYRQGYAHGKGLKGMEQHDFVYRVC